MIETQQWLKVERRPRASRCTHHDVKEAVGELELVLAYFRDLALEAGGWYDFRQSRFGVKDSAEVALTGSALLVAVAVDHTGLEAEDLVSARAPEMERCLEIFQWREHLRGRGCQLDARKGVFELSHRRRSEGLPLSRLHSRRGSCEECGSASALASATATPTDYAPDSPSAAGNGPRGTQKRHRGRHAVDSRVSATSSGVVSRPRSTHLLIVPSDDDLMQIGRVLKMLDDLEERVDSSESNHDDGELFGARVSELRKRRCPTQLTFSTAGGTAFSVMTISWQKSGGLNSRGSEAR